MKQNGPDIREQLSAPRYCDVPFPTYRFTPARDPHPTADPLGHSYVPPGQSHPEVTYHPPDHWRLSMDYLYGCDLYNHGYWWEAHEAWEGLWKKTPHTGPQRGFLQGIIQVAACHLKLFLAHADGVARLRGTSMVHLSNAAKLSQNGICMGINIDSWMNNVESYFDECAARSMDSCQHIAARYPYLLPD